MPLMTRRESEERQAAVLRFFVENPTATGDEAQRALESGRLLGGKKQPPLGQGLLFKLKRQASELASKGVKPSAPKAPSTLSGPQLQMLRERSHELQKMLADLPDGVAELHISRDGVKVVRLTTTEEDI